MQQLLQSLLKRPPQSHKNTFGHVFVIAGSPGLLGAATLCSVSALKIGAGLVTLGVPKSLYPVMQTKLTEVMLLILEETPESTFSYKARNKIMRFLEEKADVVIIGPGLSLNPSTQKLVRFLVKNSPKNIVLDADGIKALKNNLDLLKKRKCKDIILTPHPGEFSYITGLDKKEIISNKEKIAKDFSQKYRVYLILKGHRTCLASPSQKIYINKTGNPGMATAGAGDVLTGILAGLLAQKPDYDIFELCKLGIFLHGLAGDLAKKIKTVLSLTASDIIEFIPQAIKKVLSE